MTRTIRTFIPDLPRRVWVVLAGDAVAALGSGLVLPFLIVYLRDVRGIDIRTASFIVSFLAIFGLGFGFAAGTFVDKFGPRRMLILALFLCSIGSLLLSITKVPWQGFFAMGWFGLGMAALWPATHSLLTSLVPVEKRSDVYAVHYATLNLGIGLGGVVGGLVANVDNAATFEWLYRIDALSWVFFAVMLIVMKDIGNKVEHDEEAVAAAEGGYRTVLKDKLFLRVIILMSILVTVGYSQLESGFPAYSTEDGGLSTRALGAAFAGNTFLIFIAQFVVLKWMRGKRRTRGLMAICVLWMMAWSLTLIAGEVFEWNMLQNFGFIGAMMLFGLGECLVSPTVPAIVNDLAPDALRGRYNATYSFTFSIGHIVGPALAGIFLSLRWGEAFFMGLILVLGLCLLLIRELEVRLPKEVNIVTEEKEKESSAESGELERTPAITI